MAGSTVEIAAASVGETSLVKAVRKIEEEGKHFDYSSEVFEPEILQVTTEVVAEEVAAVVDELKSADADAEDAEAPAEGEASATAAEEEAEKAALTVEEVAEAEDQSPVLAAVPEESVSSIEASLEDAAPPEDAIPSEEAAITVEATPAADTSAEEAAEQTVEASVVLDTNHLAAASSESDLEVLSAAEPQSTSEAAVHETKHCHSCHSAPSAAEEVVPPVALEGQLASEGAVDVTHETTEADSLVEEPTTEAAAAVVTA